MHDYNTIQYIHTDSQKQNIQHNMHRKQTNKRMKKSTAKKKKKPTVNTKNNN